MRIVRDRFELIMVSLVSSSSLALAKSNLVFSTPRGWCLFKSLGIGGRVLRIMLVVGIEGTAYLTFVFWTTRKKRRGLAGFALGSFVGGQSKVLREEYERKEVYWSIFACFLVV